MAKSAEGRGAKGVRDEDMASPARKGRMTDFEQRLGQARGRGASAPDGEARGSALGTAFRTSSELVAGLLVGGFIGWQLDEWLGTSPVLLLVFFLLGAAAGIWNVIRTAWKMQPRSNDTGAGSGQQGSGPDDR
jgi:ATP synthase protein I